MRYILIVAMITALFATEATYAQSPKFSLTGENFLTADVYSYEDGLDGDSDSSQSVISHSNNIGEWRTIGVGINTLGDVLGGIIFGTNEDEQAVAQISGILNIASQLYGWEGRIKGENAWRLQDEVSPASAGNADVELTLEFSTNGSYTDREGGIRIVTPKGSIYVAIMSDWGDDFVIVTGPSSIVPNGMIIGSYGATGETVLSTFSVTLDLGRCDYGSYYSVGQDLFWFGGVDSNGYGVYGNNNEIATWSVMFEAFDGQLN